MTTEIKLIQSPVIQHALKEAGKQVTTRINELNLENLVATEDTVKSLKELRAELNKELNGYELQRKNIKEAVSAPYVEFEGVYKAEISEKYKAADETLKDKINGFEMKIKTEKRNSLISYFKELCEFNNIDFLTFERMNLDINLSTSEKKYKEQILEFVNQVAEDLALIETETYAAEILIEYKNTLKASAAIANIRTRKEQERIEQQRILANRIQQRIDSLTSLAFVYSDLTKTYRYINDAEIFIKYSDIEILDNSEWTKKYIELENTVKAIQKQAVSAPKVETKSATVQPKPEQKQEEIFVATFEVSGTHAELTNLKNFLIENNYNYKNI